MGLVKIEKNARAVTSGKNIKILQTVEVEVPLETFNEIAEDNEVAPFAGNSTEDFVAWLPSIAIYGDVGDVLDELVGDYMTGNGYEHSVELIVND